MDIDDFSTVRFSTAYLPERDRVALWREQYARMALRLDFEPADDTEFECGLLSRTLPGVQIMSTVVSPVRIERTREFIADGNGDLVFLINQSGTAVARACGRELVLREGDAALMSASDVTTFERCESGGSLSFRIPRSILASVIADIDNAVMRLVPRHIDVLKLLAGYAAPLFDDIALATPEFRRTAVNHLHDLVALALGASHGTNGRGLPAARLRMAKAYIAENSSRRDLSVGVVAAHLGLTPRNLQRLFESERATFSEYLLSQRLSCAHRMLTEPRLALSPVGAIAYDSGFGDLSYFNRTFRRRFGATPRDVRTERSKTVPHSE